MWSSLILSLAVVGQHDGHPASHAKHTPHPSVHGHQIHHYRPTGGTVTGGTGLYPGGYGVGHPGWTNPYDFPELYGEFPVPYGEFNVPLYPLP